MIPNGSGDGARAAISKCNLRKRAKRRRVTRFGVWTGDDLVSSSLKSSDSRQWQ